MLKTPTPSPVGGRTSRMVRFGFGGAGAGSAMKGPRPRLVRGGNRGGTFSAARRSDHTATRTALPRRQRPGSPVGVAASVVPRSGGGSIGRTTRDGKRIPPVIETAVRAGPFTEAGARKLLKKL